MKRLLYLLLLNTVSFSAYSQNDSYSFPVTQKSDAWNKMTNYQQRWDACQIPAPILSNMSTEGLVITYLNYPLLFDLLVFRTTQAGVEKLKSHFNGLPELLSRPDAHSELISRYKELYLQTIDPNWPATEIGFHVVKIVSIESLLAQPSILNALNTEKRKKLMKTVYQAYQNKQANNKYHSTVGLSSTAWLMTRIMKTDGLQLTIEKTDDVNVKTFVEQGFSINLERLLFV